MSVEFDGKLRRDDIRNIVIIAHVDHGKTTLVDCLLKQSGQYREGELKETHLDSNDQERERGITILAKNIAVPFKGKKINIIDTPGHADFGGEVERVVSMADGAILLVDAAEGPLPQTRFVLTKALERGLRPIVLINKVDRPDARPLQVLDEALELIMELGGEEVLDQTRYLFASSKMGFASTDPDVREGTMEPLLDLVVERVPGPEIREDGPLQMLVTTLDWSNYVGRISIGRIYSGSVKPGQTVSISKRDGGFVDAKIVDVMVFENLGRVSVDEASAGDVCALVGLEKAEIGDTLTDPNFRQALSRLEVDEPTVEMVFSINSSPFAGKEGKYVTGRQLRERLLKELERNVALRVRPVENSDAFAVCGRGVLHLSVLIETMRREGFELSVGKPQVILRKTENGPEEPYERLIVETPSDRVGPVMELVGARRGEMQKMSSRGEFTHVEFVIPARGLIGMRTRLLNSTGGMAILHHRFDSYRPAQGEIPHRANGVLISMVQGRANAFGLDGLQERAELFVSHGEDVYEGMIVGENARDNDLVVNPTKEKKLTNMRASGNDENIQLKPPRKFTLEAALEYIEDDELVEITPTQIRMRKTFLKETDRKRGKLRG
ncbi:MAG TPA: translational GTPase TypA [Pirellulaceae bacterium]|nr:translational GTPase TypA [Pirellulaceae bacterium]